MRSKKAPRKNPKGTNRLPDLAKFDLCEEFAEEFGTTVEYIWTEFVDPNFSDYEQVLSTLQSYFPGACF